MTPLPCPFCGSSNLSVSLGYSVGIVDYLAVECLDCESTTACQPTKEEAIAKWNRRPQDAAAQTPDTARLGEVDLPLRTSDAAAPIDWPTGAESEEELGRRLDQIIDAAEATGKMPPRLSALARAPVAYRWYFIRSPDKTWRFSETVPYFDSEVVHCEPLFTLRANGGTVTADDPDTEPGVL